MKAGRSPPIYCFLLFDCLNPLAQFDKMYPCTLKNLTPEDQIEILKKPNKFETLRPISKKTKQNKIWGSEMQKSPQNETSRPIENASKISRLRQNFPFVWKAFNLIKDPVASQADVLLAPQKSSLMNDDWG